MKVSRLGHGDIYFLLLSFHELRYVLTSVSVEKPYGKRSFTVKSREIGREIFL